MKYDCLIVDDEKELADNTSEYLNMFGVKTEKVYDAASCLSFFKDNDCKMLLLDINLPDGKGFDLCKKIRLEHDMPILFISARNTDDDKIIALNIGGDDYIEKPYSLGVLLAKIKVILKRFSKLENSSYDDGNLYIDFNENKVSLNKKPIKLTHLEYKILAYLCMNKDRLVSKDELFNNVWNDSYTQEGTLNVHIRRIREQIEENPNDPRYIITSWKEGYRFNGR